MIDKVEYKEYIFWRRQGLRAVTAFGVAKYGLWFLLEYLSKEDSNPSYGKFIEKWTKN